MTGGIVQLVAYGKEDLFLTRDPQVTFFKIIYRRHTNFSTEDIHQYFINPPDFGKRSTCLVSSEGDLIDRMALKITLPAIPWRATQFAWIRNIGHAMISYVEIDINGKTIDRHYGEWMHIWSTLTTRNILDRGIDRLLGNVPELTDFTHSKDEYTLYVPFYFWFCRSSGLALPCICLQYSEVKVHIELYELQQCCVVLPTGYIRCAEDMVCFEPYEYLVQRTEEQEIYGIFSHYDVVAQRLYYTPIGSSPMSQSYPICSTQNNGSVTPASSHVTTCNRDIFEHVHLTECVLLTDYVYLDDDERYKMAQQKHDYLIEQLFYTPSIPIQSNSAKVKLTIDQPCKLTVWLGQLDRIAEANQRFNYTDRLDHGYTRDTRDAKDLYDYHADYPARPYEPLILESTIMLNSQIREKIKHTPYFAHVQPLQSQANTVPHGCAMYSYALLPCQPIPSGTTNMSQIELIELAVRTNSKVSRGNKMKFRSYSLAYNVWRVDSGLAAPIFEK